MKLQAIEDAKRMVYLNGDIYIPKKLRKKIEIKLNKKGKLVITKKLKKK